MTDHKFADDEIIKALELCSKLDLSFEECDKCPYKGECGTKDGNMPADALALINRQKAEIEAKEEEYADLLGQRNAVEMMLNRANEEIERLNTVHADMTESLRLAAEANKDMQAEIERLKKIGNDKTSEVLRHATAIGELHKQLETAKSEAIREFAQRLKKKMYPYNGVDKKKYAINAYAVEQAIECIAKEMTEENK